MFEESLVESTALLQSRNRWPALLSVASQAIVAIMIVAVPLLHPELLPMHAPTLSLTPPRPLPPRTPPPVQRVRASVVSTAAPSASSAPSAPPAQRSFIHTLLPAAPSLADTPISTSIGTMNDHPGSALGFGGSMGSSPHVTTVSPAPSAHTGILNVSAGVTAGLLLAPIHPEYPSIVKAARQEGTVIVRAIISRTGQIERAQVVSGPAMLQSAALAAVEQARYRPYLLNGQPTEVDTTVTIVFRLGS